MARKRPTRDLKAQLDGEIAELDHDRARLVAARQALEPKQLSQDDVADDLARHPGSTYLDIAQRLGAPPRNIAAHLNRGKAAGRFQSDRGKWTVSEAKL